MSPTYAQRETPKTKKTSSFHWSLYVAIAGLFVGLIVSFQFIKQMTLEWYWLPVFILAFAAVGAALQYKWFIKKEWMHGKKGIGTFGYLAYNVLGFGSIATTLMLALNFFIPVGAPVIEEYKALSYDQRYVVHSRILTILMLEEDVYADDPDYRGVPFKATDYFLAGYRTFGFQRRVGLFGMEVKDRKYLKYDPEWCVEHEKSCAKTQEKLDIDGEQIWLDQWIIH